MATKKAPKKKKSRYPTRKMKVFCYRYVIHWNGARAAREAKYSAGTCRQVASRLLTKDYILDFISKIMEEHAMSADEAVARMTSFGRGDIADFVDEDLKFSLKDPDGTMTDKSTNIRKLRTRVAKNEFDGTETTTVEFEMHDAKDAVKMMMKYHNLLKDHNTIRLDVDGLEEMLDKEYGKEK